jgi:hypothetical protein
MIFVPTLPQSGTWFVLKLLEKCGFKLEFTGDIVDNKKIIEDKEKVALSTHIFPFYYQASPFKEVFPHYGGHPTTDYVVRKLHMGMAGIELLTRLHKTIIPMRDPLACLLTREARAPQLRHFYIVDGFLEVIKRYESHPNVFFFPVDRDSDFEDRRNLVTEMVYHCMNKASGKSYIIETTAKEWKKENTAENRYREPYENKNIGKIKDMLKEKWAEVEYLKIHGGTIKPFLQRLGYDTGSMIW